MSKADSTKEPLLSSLVPQGGRARITQVHLESYLWGAAVLLRGVIDAGDYKQFIFPLLFFKRISDVYDEEYEQALTDSGGDVDYAKFADQHRFQIPEGAHWRDVRGVGRNVGQALQNAMRAVEKANPREYSANCCDGALLVREHFTVSDAFLCVR